MSQQQQVSIQDALNIAMQHHQQNRLQEAENIYRQILQVQPRHPDALHLLGLIAHQCKRSDIGYDLINQAISASKQPPPVFMFMNLAEVCLGLNRPNEALAVMERGHRAYPLNIDLLHKWGGLHYQLGQMQQAGVPWKRITELDPNNFEAWNNYGATLEKVSRDEEARLACLRAIEINPNYAPAYNNLAFICQKINMLEEGVQYANKCIELDPKLTDAYNSRGIALVKLGRLEEAKQSWAKAIELRPNYGDAHMNVGICLLLQGDLVNGWREYEWRRRSENAISRPRELNTPQWDGSDLHGKRILLHAEQGFGDTLNFVRYAHVLKERGGTVIVECQPPLRPLLESIDGVDELFNSDQAVPQHDVQVAMMTIPLICGTTIDTIPNQVPYIKAPADRVEKWRDIVNGPAKPGTLKVALAWAGSPIHQNDRNRSSKLADFAQLAELSDKVTFYSLQKGPQAFQAKTPPEGMQLIDFTDDIKDFADTAAIMEHLDLLISVDTSVVHIAGALNRPAWVMLPFIPDWRWLMEGDTTNWYPSLRFFRRKFEGDWLEVMSRIKVSLADLIQQKLG